MKTSVVLKLFKFRQGVKEGGPDGPAPIAQVPEPAAAQASRKAPMATDLQANYEMETLFQYQMSFRLSLIFASIGFLVMVVAAFMHSSADAESTIVRFVTGGIVDAIAALFFVHSKRAQRTIDKRLEEQRRDRNQAQAFNLLSETWPDDAERNALRAYLALHYSEVKDADKIAREIYAMKKRQEIAEAPPKPRSPVGATSVRRGRSSR